MRGKLRMAQKPVHRPTTTKSMSNAATVAVLDSRCVQLLAAAYCCLIFFHLSKPFCASTHKIVYSSMCLHAGFHAGMREMPEGYLLQ